MSTKKCTLIILTTVRWIWSFLWKSLFDRVTSIHFINLVKWSVQQYSSNTSIITKIVNQSSWLFKGISKLNRRESVVIKETLEISSSCRRNCLGRNNFIEIRMKMRIIETKNKYLNHPGWRSENKGSFYPHLYRINTKIFTKEVVLENSSDFALCSLSLSLLKQRNA